MSLEDEVKALLDADPTLLALAEGGVYSDAYLGVEGFHRGVDSRSAAAFDVEGKLLPCILIREGPELPYGNARNDSQGFIAVGQGFGIFYFQMRGRERIDLMKGRVLELLSGKRVGRGYPVWKTGETSAIPDSGPILNSTSLRQDWLRVRTLQFA